MGLFDKKYCDICGDKIGLLGNRKLEDGNMCKECAKLISPWLTGRKGYTVEEMKEHLAYREENKEKVQAFSATKVLGLETKVYIDEDNGQFLVYNGRNFKEGNPDVLDFSQITGCRIDIDEHEHEIFLSIISVINAQIIRLNRPTPTAPANTSAIYIGILLTFNT